MDEKEELELNTEIRELLESKQYTRLRQKAAELNEADVAAVMENLEDAEQFKMFRILPKSMAADVFAHLETDTQQYIITTLSERDAGNIIDNLMADDAADLLEEMPANVVKKLLANASPETRRDVNHLLQYPEDSAGSIMTVEYVDLKENLTVSEAIERIRKLGVDSETINICYVLDNKRTLLGTVALRYLLLSDPDAAISDIMHENVISLNTLMDQEEVARQFQKYDFTAMPVVDNEERLVGIITIDDIVDILQEEATEDIEKMAAIRPSDKPYLQTSAWQTYLQRIPWLMLLMISAIFTSVIITRYERALETTIILSACMPMLMDTGGNCGGQASVTIIRALSLGDVEFSDILRILWKEFRVGILCGVSLAIVNFVKMMIQYPDSSFAVKMVVSLSLFLAIIVAKLIGCLLPMLADKIGFDPAVMSSPFITTIVDALSLLIYFSLAVVIMHISVPA